MLILSLIITLEISSYIALTFVISCVSCVWPFLFLLLGKGKSGPWVTEWAGWALLLIQWRYLGPRFPAASADLGSGTELLLLNWDLTVTLPHGPLFSSLLPSSSVGAHSSPFLDSKAGFGAHPSLGVPGDFRSHLLGTDTGDPCRTWTLRI